MDKYNIARKADSIGLSILIHDLTCYNEDLQQPASDSAGFIRKLRNTRNVFVSLHNVKEMLNDVRVHAEDAFVVRTRALRRDLEFIVHVRNKGVGHLDRELLKRAAQWEPHIFHEAYKGNTELIAFLCYKALLETSINSYQATRSGRRLFSSEIDLLYPEDAKEFFDFLSRVICDCIDWLTEARSRIDAEIDYYAGDTLYEMAAVAGQTNFDLNASTDLDVDMNEVQAALRESLQQIRDEGANEKVVAMLEKRFIPNGESEPQ